MKNTNIRRLTYPPRAYVFIRSRTQGGKIFDVSSDVVRGSITQNVNDYSTLNFELRNRHRKWLRGPDGRPIFLPMDMVTMWLQRIPGKPIQQFTGYLDSAPYYQALPGNAYFTATCTLKRLAYTWFDPGMPIFLAWLSDNGWTFNPTTGVAQNYDLAYNTTTYTNGFDAGKAAATAFSDGGFARLLSKFMTDIAGWDPDDVLVSSIPTDIPEKAASIFAEIQQNTKQDLERLAKFMSIAMGITGYTTATGTTGNSDTPTASSTSVTKAVEKIKRAAKSADIPPIVLVIASLALTNLDESYSVKEGAADNWGYGLYAMRPNILTGGTTGTMGTVTSIVPALRADTIDGATLEEMMDGATATSKFCARLNKNVGEWVQGAKNNNMDDIRTWVRKALGRPLPQGVDWVDVASRAKKYLGTSVVVAPQTNMLPPIDASDLTFNNPTIQSMMSDEEKAVAKTYYSKVKPYLAYFVYLAKNISPQINLTYTPPDPKVSTTGMAEGGVNFSGPESSLRSFFDSLRGRTEIDSVVLNISNQDMTYDALRKGAYVKINKIGAVSFFPKGIYIQMTNPPIDLSTITPAAPGAPDASISPAPAIQEGRLPYSTLAAFSANAAFASRAVFESDILKAYMLTGNKSLMNDVPAMDAVKQFCQASMRAFRSLPDGRFLAFYPDYFGNTRTPYWSISNLEMTNFGVQINDEQLATHVYVVGDTMFGADQTINEVASHGVATVTQAGLINAFVNSSDANNAPFGDLQDAKGFLEHYGARPYKEEAAIIRNSYFEFLMAWQRFMQKWASQFATTAEFTFQPEVMAGGLLLFPEHHIQMYVNSVTHTFDYEGGFTTSAVLSAPSIPKGERNIKVSMPGFALGGMPTVGA